MLITCGLLAADSESQYITWPFNADGESGADQGASSAADRPASQWLENKCLLKLSWLKIQSSAECTGREMIIIYDLQ